MKNQKALPYVYWLTHKTTGEFYIGYRSKNILPSEIDIQSYQTSSKKIHFIGFENFNVKIIAEFFDANDAYDFEQRLIEEHFKDPLNLNGKYTKAGKDRFKNRPGRVTSEETKKKISMALIGKKRSLETRQKMAKANTNPSELKRSQIIESNRTRGCSDETRKKMSLARKNKMSGSNNPRASSWIILNEHDRDNRLIIDDLVQFCNDHELSPSRLRRTGGNKKNKFYKGFRAEKLESL